jgi:hypothetical protein
MLICIIAVRIYFSFLKEIYPFSPFVFWNETVALVAFGISWLTKGGTFYPDKKE